MAAMLLVAAQQIQVAAVPEYAFQVTWAHMLVVLVDLAL
jgi:hypothetical protein